MRIRWGLLIDLRGLRRLTPLTLSSAVKASLFGDNVMGVFVWRNPSMEFALAANLGTHWADFGICGTESQ